VTSTIVVIDGKSLSCATLAAVARQQAGVAVGEPAVAAARAAWVTGQEPAARQPVYGTNTGVGANHVGPCHQRCRGRLPGRTGL
jgi:histidine ammonia-lyase